MFAPKGFYRWVEMREALQAWASEILKSKLSAQGLTVLSESGSRDHRTALFSLLTEEGVTRTIREAEFTNGLLARWLLSNLMDQFETMLCSPNGLLCEAEAPALMHADRFDFFSIAWPDYYNGAMHGYFENFNAGSFNLDDVDARFIAIDVPTGIIKMKNNTYQLYDRCANYAGTMDQIRSDIDKFVRPFAGWAVCWRMDALPTTPREVLEELGYPNIDFGEQFDVSDTGRQVIDLGEPVVVSNEKSASLDAVMACVLEAFPNGKGAATWADVEKSVGYSRRHIIRNLKQAGTYSQWIRGGHHSD